VHDNGQESRTSASYKEDSRVCWSTPDCKCQQASEQVRAVTPLHAMVGMLAAANWQQLQTVPAKLWEDMCLMNNTRMKDCHRGINPHKHKHSKACCSAHIHGLQHAGSRRRDKSHNMGSTAWSCWATEQVLTWLQTRPAYAFPPNSYETQISHWPYG